MSTVERKENESFEQLLRRFRGAVIRARILSETKKRRYFVSKSDKRRIARRKAARRERQRQRRQNQASY